MERSSCAFALCWAHAIILDLVREESITVPVLPDKELVLANLDLASHWSGFHIFSEIKSKVVQRPPALKVPGQRQVMGYFWVSSMLLFLKGGNTGECRIFQNWFQWRWSTAAACQHCHDSTRVGVSDKWQPVQCKDGGCSAKVCRAGQRQTLSGWRRSVNWQELEFRIKLSDEMRRERRERSWRVEFEGFYRPELNKRRVKYWGINLRKLLLQTPQKPVNAPQNPAAWCQSIDPAHELRFEYLSA